MANSQQRSASQPADMLAAVALHVLVNEGRHGMTQTEVAQACERNAADRAELHETEMALKVLLEDGLVESDRDLFKPTRAAVRAAELSF